MDQPAGQLPAPAAGATLERHAAFPKAMAGAMVGVFAFSIFASAFLLFLIEPMVAKMVLPLVGGTAAVWTASVLFFQAVLLVGYGYSHWLAMRIAWRWQALLHGALLLSVFLVLPIHLVPGWNPPASGSPVGWVVLVLAAAVGLPFFVLSTTSPLVQHWFSRTGHPHAGDPYFLYLASNLGSALGLLSYPALIEPFVGLHAQAQLWTLGYVTFLVVVVLSLGVVAWTNSRGGARSVAASAAVTADGARPMTALRRARWVVLAAIPSTWMLAVTSYFTTVIRPIPLLWVIPLTLYLLSFVVVFARRQVVPRRWLNRLFPFYALPLLGMVLLGGGGPLWALAILHFGAFFLAALLCHGELAADRPHHARLTEFYWWLGVGGAAGGLVTAVIAPLVFNDFYEYPLAIIGAALLRPALVMARDRRDRVLDFALPALIAVILLGVVLAASVAGVLRVLDRTPLTDSTTASDLFRVLVVFAIPAAISAAFTFRPTRFGMTATAMLLLSLLPIGSQAAIFQQRDFFGVHKVVSSASGSRHALIDGGTIHGVEVMDAAGRDVPTSYYSRTGPIGDAFHAGGVLGPTASVAVIGLGAGTMACYAQPQQSWTFYEIDPVVVRIARDRSLFTFLDDCAPRATVVLGDGRLGVASAPGHGYDAIVLDAFGSDAIPVHLLTREAIQLYLSKLKPGGYVMFNISNKYVDLAPILAGEAAALSLTCLERVDSNITAEEADAGVAPSDWVLMSPYGGAGAAIASLPGWHALSPQPGFPVWTDDFSDVLSVTRLG